MLKSANAPTSQPPEVPLSLLRFSGGNFLSLNNVSMVISSFIKCKHYLLNSSCCDKWEFRLFITTGSFSSPLLKFDNYITMFSSISYLIKYYFNRWFVVPVIFHNISWPLSLSGVVTSAPSFLPPLLSTSTSRFSVFSSFACSEAGDICILCCNDN